MAAEAPRLIREDIDFLALLPEVRQRELLAGSTQVDYPAGFVPFRPEDPPIAFLVERGLVRIFRSIPDGRQATVAFMHASELVGGIKIMGEHPTVSVQTVVDSTLTILQFETVRELAEIHTDLLTGIAKHLAAQLDSAFRLISIRSLGDITERLAYDVLERACRHQLGAGRLEVRATHAELAESIGSSREVVSRALKGLRAAGLVITAPGVIRITEPVRLANIVRAFTV
jgi:CRP-like cAMP-binding protein